MMSNFSSIFKDSERMPLLFLGHGSPMNAIEENQFTNGLKKIATAIPLPQAILCISAHWNTAETMVTAMQTPPTIHDFYGFPEELYQIQYPAVGCPLLAKEVKSLLTSSKVILDEKWGLDHGTWSVLKHLFPLANIPVVQLSINYSKDPVWHFDFAKFLRSLRDKGILIIGSGNIIHNLGLIDFEKYDQDNYGFDWAIEAKEKLNTWIMNEDIASLTQYQKQGKSIELSIPTPEHFIPLLYILGLKDKSENIEFFNDKLVAGSLSMTSIKIS